MFRNCLKLMAVSAICAAPIMAQEKPEALPEITSAMAEEAVESVSQVKLAQVEGSVAEGSEIILVDGDDKAQPAPLPAPKAVTDPGAPPAPGAGVPVPVIENAPMYVDSQNWVDPNYPMDAPEENGGGGGIIAGVGFYYLKPNWESSDAFYSGSNLNAAGVPTSQRSAAFDWDLEISPYFYLGYLTQSGLGGRARYWDFDHSVSTGATVQPGNTSGSARPLGLAIPTVTAGQNFTVSSTLDFYVLDIEAFKVWNVCGWNIEGAAGLRHVDLEQNHFFRVNTGASLRSVSTFSGVGPTFALAGRRSLGALGLSLFANTRFSVLFGDEAQQASLVSAVNRQRLAESESVLPIGEIEIGARWTGNFGSLAPFLEVSGVGQTWWGIGNSSNSNLSDPPAGGYDNSNMGLVGARITAGIGY